MEVTEAEASDTLPGPGPSSAPPAASDAVGAAAVTSVSGSAWSPRGQAVRLLSPRFGLPRRGPGGFFGVSAPGQGSASAGALTARALGPPVILMMEEGRRLRMRSG